MKPTTSDTPNMIPAVFLDANQEASFKGYRRMITDDTPELWNGWECPLFDLHTVRLILLHVNTPESGHHLTIRKDGIVEERHTDYPDEIAACYAPIDTPEYGRLWPIGAESWIWSLAPTDDPNGGEKTMKTTTEAQPVRAIAVNIPYEDIIAAAEAVSGEEQPDNRGGEWFDQLTEEIEEAAVKALATAIYWEWPTTVTHTIHTNRSDHHPHADRITLKGGEEATPEQYEALYEMTTRAIETAVEQAETRKTARMLSAAIIAEYPSEPKGLVQYVVTTARGDAEEDEEKVTAVWAVHPVDAAARAYLLTVPPAGHESGTTNVYIADRNGDAAENYATQRMRYPYPYAWATIRRF